MQKITESLAGRMVRYKLYPLFNAELKDREENVVEQLFNQEFITLQSHASLVEVIDSTIRGGYPEIVDYERELLTCNTSRPILS